MQETGGNVGAGGGRVGESRGKMWGEEECQGSGEGMGRVQETEGNVGAGGGRVGEGRGKMWGDGECQGHGESEGGKGRVGKSK